MQFSCSVHEGQLSVISCSACNVPDQSTRVSCQSYVFHVQCPCSVSTGVRYRHSCSTFANNNTILPSPYREISRVARSLIEETAVIKKTYTCTRRRRERQTEGQKCRDTQRKRQAGTDIQTARETYREREGQTDGRTDRQADRQTDRQAGRQAGRKAGRQAETEKDRDRDTETDRQRQTPERQRHRHRTDRQSRRSSFLYSNKRSFRAMATLNIFLTTPAPPPPPNPPPLPPPPPPQPKKIKSSEGVNVPVALSQLIILCMFLEKVSNERPIFLAGTKRRVVRWTEL